MKAAAFTIALLLGGTAIAQTTTTDTTTTSTDTAATGTMSTDTSMGTTSTSDTMGTGQTGQSTTGSSWSNSTTGTTGTTSQYGGMSTGTTLASNSMAGGQTVAPDNSHPERDARGIRVISAPAVVPAGWNGTMGSNTGMGGPELDASGQATTASNDLPACSRTVTDHCLQTYERGRRR